MRFSFALGVFCLRNLAVFSINNPYIYIYIYIVWSRHSTESHFAWVATRRHSPTTRVNANPRLMCLPSTMRLDFIGWTWTISLLIFLRNKLLFEAFQFESCLDFMFMFVCMCLYGLMNLSMVSICFASFFCLLFSRSVNKPPHRYFKLSPKNEAGVFCRFATFKGTFGSMLLVGEGKYVVAREHVANVQDHFSLQAGKSANPELEWLHKLLGRNNDNDIWQEAGKSNLVPLQEEETAIDPTLRVPETVPVADVDSDGLESDDEVKAGMEQLDESDPLLSEFRRTVAAGNGDEYSRTVVAGDSDDDDADQGKHGHGVDFKNHPTRSSKRHVAGKTRDAMNTAELRARSSLPNQIDRAKTMHYITENELRANKTILIGRKIKRFRPQMGGVWALVESYLAVTD